MTLAEDGLYFPLTSRPLANAMAPFPRMQFQARLSDFIPVFSAIAAPRISPEGRRKMERNNIGELLLLIQCIIVSNRILTSNLGQIYDGPCVSNSLSKHNII